MKKIILISAALLFAATSAFATNTVTTGTGALGSASSATMTITTSNNVVITYNGTATSYALGAANVNGTFTYGTSSGDTKVFKASGSSVAIPAAPAGTATATWPAAWSSM